ncbi:MAG: phytanoyl-CoA dioxygenase family protein, partial [Pseudomonadota bacterium]|nr:phytanoyl-CoA dioxygenase family protein [Pseudomonadota bacterium]
RGLKSHHPLNVLDFIGQHDDFLPLIDLPQTFMKVVDILGWHIQLYHSHMIVTPPLPDDYEPHTARLGWHQDSGRLNLDIESSPRPRISLKVGFFLTDTKQPDRGNFHVIPGSHLTNALSMPDDDATEHPDAIPLLVGPGDAVIFDRRLWHSGGRNFSAVTRKVLFYGYSYRWLKPRDDMTVAHYMDRSDSIRQQLLGASPNGGFGYTSPADEDVPLKIWLQEKLGEDAVIL